jgi:hypothetical protein
MQLAVLVGVALGATSSAAVESPDKIYYTDGSAVYHVNPDGSGITALPTSVPNGHPSVKLHAGKRFFLTVKHMAGELNWRNQNRYDLVATDDAGVQVRLTNNVDHGHLRYLSASWRFTYDETDSTATIIGLAHELNPDGTSVNGSGGIYFGEVSWDGNGNISLLTAPFLVSNAAGVAAAGDNVPNIWTSFSYNHVAGQIAVDDRDVHNTIRLIDIATNTITTVLQGTTSTNFRDIVHTPSLDKLLFARSDTGVYDYIEKINPDGTSRAVIYKSARNVTLGVPSPSPDSASLVFTNYSTSGSGRWDVYKVSINGGKVTNVTAGAATTSNVVLAWRGP